MFPLWVPIIYTSLAELKMGGAATAHLVGSYHLVPSDNEGAGGVAIAVDRAQGAGEAIVLQLGLVVVLLRIVLIFVAVRLNIGGSCRLVGGAGVLVRSDELIVVESI